LSEIRENSPSELQLVPKSGSPAALAAAWILMVGVFAGAVAVAVSGGGFVAMAVASWGGVSVAARVGSAVAVAGVLVGSVGAGAG
jgi:hypothetical protein